MDPSRTYSQDTLLQHLGEESKINGAVVQPLFQNSLFLFESQAEFSFAMQNPSEVSNFYSRMGNPTLSVAEKKIAMLEGVDRCILVGSGMAAIALSIFSAVRTGSNVVAVDTCYGPVRELLSSYLTKFGVTTTYVEGHCPEEVLDAITPETTLVYLESPSSLLFRLQDLETISAACRVKGVTTIIDNTYSTPLYQNPAAFGIDIVLHSATKYLGGHSDIIAGAICTDAKRVQSIVKNELGLFGSTLAPFPAWLLTRGLRTLKLRLKQHEETGNTIAGWLEDQSWVERVHHVGLPSFGQRDLYRKQMRGTGGLFSFEPKNQDEKAVTSFIEDLKLFGLGVSWGGFESLVVQASVTPLPHRHQRRVVRFFTGLEDPKDLMQDIEASANKHLI